MREDEGPRVIKRYANRKLYDMAQSCYVTHDEIAALVERGEKLRIIDNTTKEDLTSATLSQILFDKEKRSRSGDMLRALVQRITQPVSNLRDEAEQKVRNVLRSRSPEREDEPEERANASEALRELLTTTQAASQSLQKNVEDRWNVLVKYVGQFDVNHRRIVELERRVLELETRLAAYEATVTTERDDPSRDAAEVGGAG